MVKAQATAKQTVEREQAVAPKPTVLDEAINNTRSGLISRAANLLMVRPDRLLTMLRNVWTVSKGQPPLTDEELFVGVSMIAKYELDPTAKEIYVTRNKDGRLMTIIGIDGFVKILCRTEGYDGFEQIDDFGDNRKSIRSITTIIWHKKRSHPTSYCAYYEEYARVGGFVSKAMPIHMLRLFSLRHAVRLFTPIGGQVVTEEEFHAMARSMEDATTATTKSDRLKQVLQAKVEPAVQPSQADTTPTPVPKQEPTQPVSKAFDEHGNPALLPADVMRAKVEEMLTAATGITEVERIRFEWADCSAINQLCDERLQQLAPNEPFQLGDPHQMEPLTGSQYYDQEG